MQARYDFDVEETKIYSRECFVASERGHDADVVGRGRGSALKVAAGPT
jgi:hypothetical protein